MHVPGIIENGKVINDDKLFTEACRQDVEFFERHPDRVYRARPAHALERFQYQDIKFDETRHQPAAIVKRWVRNGLMFMTREYVGAPVGVDLYSLDDDFLRRLFEPTLH
jgi:hypothetical protein